MEDLGGVLPKILEEGTVDPSAGSSALLRALPENHSPAAVAGLLENHRRALARLLEDWAKEQDKLLDSIITTNGTHHVSFKPASDVVNHGAARTVTIENESEPLGCTIVWPRCTHDEPYVGEIIVGSTAERHGLATGDRIIEIDGVATKGKSRRLLLPSIQKRPVRITFERCEDHPRQTSTVANNVVKSSDASASQEIKGLMTTPFCSTDNAAKSSYDHLDSQQTDNNKASGSELLSTCVDGASPNDFANNSINTLQEQERPDGLATASPKKGLHFEQEQDLVPSKLKEQKSTIVLQNASSGLLPPVGKATTGYYQKKPELALFDSSSDLDATRHLVQDYRQEEWKMLFGKRAAIVEQWYSYWEHLHEPERTGPLARFIRRGEFECICVLVIIANGVDIYYKTNARMSEAFFGEKHVSSGQEEVFNLLEVFFLVFYTAEMILKLAVHKLYFFANEQARWNNFEFWLVASSYVDLVLHESSINLTFLRSFRLLKVLRLVRALRFLKELRIMLTSMVGCLSPLFWASIMLIFLLSMFSIIFTTQVSDFLSKATDADPDMRDELFSLFPSVQGGCLTLLEAVSGGADWQEAFSLLEEVGTATSCLFIFFILFFLISVWNVVTSLFIEKAMSTAQPDMSNIIYEQHMRDLRYSEDLMTIIHDLDTDHNGFISYDEFLAFFSNEHCRAFFVARGIDIKDAQKFFQILSSISGQEEVDCESFVQGCMRMKGMASSLDVQTVRFECRLMHAYCKREFHHIFKMLDPHGHHHHPHHGAKASPSSATKV